MSIVDLGAVRQERAAPICLACGGPVRVVPIAVIQHGGVAAIHPAARHCPHCGGIVGFDYRPSEAGRLLGEPGTRWVELDEATYPEHARLAAAIEPYQADPVATITEFLQWLEDEHRIKFFWPYGQPNARMIECSIPADVWPLLFFKIDVLAFDEESRAMREEAPDAC